MKTIEEKRAYNRERAKKWRDRNLEKVREYVRKRRAANPEKSREACRKYRETHRTEVYEYNKAYAAKHPEMRLASQEKSSLKKFGLTPKVYRELLEFQGNVCSICKGPSNGKGRFHVDHDHATGHIRGLLCSRCNTALGNFKDDTQRLLRAVEYLEETRKVVIR